MNKLSTQPYKGSRDFFPQDMRTRNYIHDTWKKVCKLYGYQEYDGPFLEPFDLYAAKTGEEIVNEQLYTFEDRAGRKLAIRPEMTPTLARMIAAKYKTLARPIRWFSIPNLWRYEKPQRGRLREHFQLNVDMFGIANVEADYEIINVAISIMEAFGATNEMYEIRVGNRRLIEDFYNKLNLSPEQKIRVTKAIDKKPKISEDTFLELLKPAKLDINKVDAITNFLNDPGTDLINLFEANSVGAQEVNNLLSLFAEAEQDISVKYDPTIMRGFDYYTGNVFEQFDKNPNNNRSMYGGGRYDDLMELFANEKLTGTGFGMGDVTLLNFLVDWDLLPSIGTETQYLVTVWPSSKDVFYNTSAEFARALRYLGKSTELWPQKDTKIEKQLKYANKMGIQNIVIIGEEELSTNTVTIKDMFTGEQHTIEAENATDYISKP